MTMRPTKLLFDHQAFLEQQYGGVSRYICEVATRLSMSERFSVVVAAGLHVNELLQPDQLRVIGKKIRPVKRTASLRAYFNRTLESALIQAWRPNIVHETYYRRWDRGAAQAKVVVTMHDFIHERHSMFFDADPTVARRKVAMDRADALVCVSHATRQYLCDLYPQHAAKSTVIQHGQNYSEPSRQALAAIDKFTGGRPFLLYVGSRFGYKNFPMFVNAFAASLAPDESAVLVCFGGGEFDATELAQMREAGLAQEQCLQLSGSDDLLHATYKRAATFAYPSLEEGFGIPLLEARAAGCPVACSRIPVFEEVLQADAFYFDPRSVDGMADALQLAFNAGGNVGTRTPAPIQRFSWQRSADLHGRLYASLA